MSYAGLPAIRAVEENSKTPYFVVFYSEIAVHTAALQAASYPAFGSEVTSPTLLSVTGRYILL